MLLAGELTCVASALWLPSYFSVSLKFSPVEMKAGVQPMIPSQLNPIKGPLCGLLHCTSSAVRMLFKISSLASQYQDRELILG